MNEEDNDEDSFFLDQEEKENDGYTEISMYSLGLTENDFFF